MEETDSCTLACTLAWDTAAATAAAAGASSPSLGAGLALQQASASMLDAASSPQGHGCDSAVEAAKAAVSALRSIQPPALPSAYALHLSK